MLSKVSNSTISGYINIEKSIPDTYSFKGETSKTYTVLDNMPFTGTVDYTLDYVCNVSTSRTCTFKFNDTTIFNGYPHYTQNLSGTVPFVKDMPLNLIGTIHNSAKTYTHDIKNIVFTYNGNIDISKNYNKASLPRQLKTIGEKATSTLFGKHIDNTRYTGE